MKSDFYNFDKVLNFHKTIHKTIIQGIDDEQLRVPRFRFQEMGEAVVEKY